MQTNTTVSLPVEVKSRALSYRIGFSETLREALIAKIEELDREKLGGTPDPEHPELNNRGRILN